MLPVAMFGGQTLGCVEMTDGEQISDFTMMTTKLSWLYLGSFFFIKDSLSTPLARQSGRAYIAKTKCDFPRIFHLTMAHRGIQ